MARSAPARTRLLRSHRGALAVLLATFMASSPPVQGQPAARAVPEKVIVDWQAVARDALTLSPRLGIAVSDLRPQLRARVASRLARYETREGMQPLALLNEFAAHALPGMTAIPVPVLLPFETARFVEEWAPRAGRPERLRQEEYRRYLHGTDGTLQLVPGRTGYDALIVYQPRALSTLGIASRKPRLVHLAGAALSYQGAAGGDPVADLEGDFPGLRRQRGEDEVGYTFRRYGVPYFAIVSCSDDPAAADALSCAQAEQLLRATLRNITLVGGNPLPVAVPAATQSPPRPRRASPTFKYHPPGKLLDGTGDDGMDGAPDYTVYGDIRFPIQTAPSFAQSQVFMHWGNCLSSPGTTDKMVPLPPQPGDTHPRYRCVQNQKPLLRWEGHPENYAYPWRDNFCESRLGSPGSTAECPAGRGHQGQDIRPRTCPGAATSATCRTDVHEVVAVLAGKACRDGNKVRLRFDTTTLYYVYLHMNTNTMSAAGIPDQRCTPVAEGRVIGKVGNFQGRRGGTSTHLHFEIHPINLYSRFNPYMTLVRAYERLIGAQGTEITGAKAEAPRRTRAAERSCRPLPLSRAEPNTGRMPGCPKRHRPSASPLPFAAWPG
jgi:hypothetical protein